MNKDSLVDSLKYINSNPNVEISCLVKTNGDVLASVGQSDTLKLETFGIMSATIFGAATTSNEQLNKNKPEQISIQSLDGSTMIFNLLEKYLLVVRAKDGFDEDDIKEVFGKHINDIKNNIK